MEVIILQNPLIQVLQEATFCCLNALIIVTRISWSQVFKALVVSILLARLLLGCCLSVNSAYHAVETSLDVLLLAFGKADQLR